MSVERERGVERGGDGVAAGFASRLRDASVKAGYLTSYQLHQAMVASGGFVASYPTLNRYWNGRTRGKRINAEAIAALARVLNTSERWLWAGCGDAPAMAPFRPVEGQEMVRLTRMVRDAPDGAVLTLPVEFLRRALLPPPHHPDSPIS